MEYLDAYFVPRVISALETAKETLRFLPPLPENMKPVYFRILNAMYQIRDDFGCSRVSDINRTLRYLLPNTTKYIHEMIERNVIEKFHLESDKRVVLIRATDLGEAYIQRVIVGFNSRLEKEFLKIGRSNCNVMIETIGKIHDAIKNAQMDM